VYHLNRSEKDARKFVPSEIYDFEDSACRQNYNCWIRRFHLTQTRFQPRLISPIPNYDSEEMLLPANYREIQYRQGGQTNTMLQIVLADFPYMTQLSE